MNIDQRNKLSEEPFDYKITKDQSILIYWQNKHIHTLRGDASLKLIKQLKNSSTLEVQLALAKVTGNFKRGNEKANKNKR